MVPHHFNQRTKPQRCRADARQGQQINVWFCRSPSANARKSESRTGHPVKRVPQGTHWLPVLPQTRRIRLCWYDPRESIVGGRCCSLGPTQGTHGYGNPYIWSSFNVWLLESKPQISESIVLRSNAFISRHGICETLPSRAARRTMAVALARYEGVHRSCSTLILSRPRKCGRARTSAGAAMASKVSRSRVKFLRVWQPGNLSSKGTSSV